MKIKDKKEYLETINMIENDLLEGIISNEQYDEKMDNLKHLFFEKV